MTILSKCIVIFLSSIKVRHNFGVNATKLVFNCGKVIFIRSHTNNSEDKPCKSFLNVVYFQKKLFFLHIWTIFNDPRNSLTLALLLWTILITFRVLSYNNPMTYYNKYLLRLIKFRKRCDRVAIVWILVTAKLIDFHWHLFPMSFQVSTKKDVFVWIIEFIPYSDD